MRKVVAGASLVLVWAGVSTTLVVSFTGKIRDWSVMTDEMLYEKLATSIAQRHSLLPAVRGMSVSVVNQLYPLVIAPEFAAADVPKAFHRAHEMNAPLMTSAVFPAYLLAREVASRRWALAVALMSVLLPWIVLTGFLLTEVAAYPAFLWAILAMHRSVAEPTLRRDLIAVAAVAVAVLARTQLLVLAVVFPLTILVHEAAIGFADQGRPLPIARRLREGTRRALQRHRFLGVLYAAGLVTVGAVSVVGSTGDLLGSYSVTVRGGNVLPLAVWPAVVSHVDELAIACGFIPFVLGAGWVAVAFVRPSDRRSQALAALFLLAGTAIVVETASFDVRFQASGAVSERYQFYVVPLALVATVAALRTVTPRRVAAGGAVATVLFVATLPLLLFPTFTRLEVDNPARVVLDEMIRDQAGSLGPRTFVAVAAAALGLIVTLGLVLLPRTSFALVVLGALLVFSVMVTRDEIDRVLAGHSPSGRAIAQPPYRVLNWVDTALPKGAAVAMVPYAVTPDFPTSALLWWDVEFWNRSIDREYVATDGLYSYAGFPTSTLRPDWTSGRVPGTADALPYLVVSPDDTRFQFQGLRQADGPGLQVLAAYRPYRAVFLSKGLYPDGWTHPRPAATFRFYNHDPDHARPFALEIPLTAPSTTTARYRIRSPRGTRTAVIAAGSTTVESLQLCVHAGSHTDVVITSESTARAPGAPTAWTVMTTRRVGVHVGAIVVGEEPLTPPCR